MQGNNLLTSLSKVMGFIYYKGCNIEVVQGGFKIFNQEYKTEMAAKQAVDDAFKAIKNSIKYT